MDNNYQALIDLLSQFPHNQIRRRLIKEAMPKKNRLKWLIDLQLFLSDYLKGGIHPESGIFRRLQLEGVMELIDELIDDIKSTLNPSKIRTFTHPQFNKNPNLISDLFRGLKKSEFIEQSASLWDFKKLFQGVDCSKIKPIKWTNSLESLSYFIKQINEQELVNNLTRNKWEVTRACFLDKSGRKLGQNISRQNPPVDTSALDTCISLLKY